MTGAKNEVLSTEVEYKVKLSGKPRQEEEQSVIVLRKNLLESNWRILEEGELGWWRWKEWRSSEGRSHGISWANMKTLNSIFSKCFPWQFHIRIWYILVGVPHSHPYSFSSSSQPCFLYFLIYFLFRALQSLTRGICVTFDLDLSFKYWWGSQRLCNWILCLSLSHNLLITKCSRVLKIN